MPERPRSLSIGGVRYTFAERSAGDAGAMRLLLFVGTLVSLSFSANAQTTAQTLQVGFCFGAYNEMEKYFQNIEEGMNSNDPNLSALAEAVNSLDQNKKTLLAYLLSENALQNIGVELAMVAGKNDADSIGDVNLPKADQDEASIKYQVCQGLVNGLPY